MQVHSFENNLFSLSTFTVSNTYPQVIRQLEYFLYYPIYLGYHLKHLGNRNREPEGYTSESSTTSEENEEENENNDKHQPTYH